MDLTDANWRKSSYSSNNGGNCVEVATVWRKSTYSSNKGGACIEVAAQDGAGRVVAVRDSKDPDGPKLAFAPADWEAFMRQVKAGALGLA
jgi:Domain of unknown function (DUF397)